MWPRDRDSNPRYAINVCQFSRLVHSTALPSLDLFLYSTIKKGGLSTPRSKMAGVEGFEPSMTGSKPVALTTWRHPKPLLS